MINSSKLRHVVKVLRKTNKLDSRNDPIYTEVGTLYAQKKDKSVREVAENGTLLSAVFSEITFRAIEQQRLNITTDDRLQIGGIVYEITSSTQYDESENWAIISAVRSEYVC